MVQYEFRQSDRADLLDTLMESLVSADPDIFPNTIILLVLGYTLPARSPEAEHSFSAVRLIKNDLRNRIVDTRISALTLMKIYLDVCSRPTFSTNWCRFTRDDKYLKNHCFFLMSVHLEINDQSAY